MAVLTCNAGANKIEQKSTMSTTYLSFPTKVCHLGGCRCAPRTHMRRQVSTIRILRMRAAQNAAPKIDANDPRVAHF
jgi:hypothetical protein